jgi:hypothetical protein
VVRWIVVNSTNTVPLIVIVDRIALDEAIYISLSIITAKVKQLKGVRVSGCALFNSR